MTTKSVFAALLAALALAAPAQAESTSTFRPIPGTYSLPPTTDGDRYVLLGDREDTSFVVTDTVGGAPRKLAKGAGCGWGEAPRTAFAGAVLMLCPVDGRLVQWTLTNLRTGAVRVLPAASGYAAVGRSWIAGYGDTGDFFLHRRRDEVRRASGLRDLDDPRLRRVCRRLPGSGGSGRPETATLAYDAKRYLVISDRGLQLRPCARRGRAVRLERGRFGGFELPDYATLSAGLVTWPSLRESLVILGYDARTKRRWSWLAEAEDVPLHTRNLLLVRRPALIGSMCGSLDCEVARWGGDVAKISRKAKPKPKKKKRRRRS